MDEGRYPLSTAASDLAAELAPRGSRRWLLRALLAAAAFPALLLQARDRGLEGAEADASGPLSSAAARFVDASAEIVLEGRPRALGIDVAANLATLLGHADPKTGELILDFVESARLVARLYGGARFCVDARQSRVELLRTLAAAVSATCHLCFYGDPVALHYLTEKASAGPGNKAGVPG